MRPRKEPRRKAELVVNELAALRGEAYDPEEENMGFYTRILGGAWAAKHKSVTADAVSAFARGGLPTTWCRLYGWPRQMSAYYSKHGQMGAHMLAKEWARRSHYFYWMWATSEDEDFSYTDEQLRSYSMSLEWLEFMTELPTESESFGRGSQINRLLPRQSSSA